MPRFNLKLVLVLFVFIAIWFASAKLQVSAGKDLRKVVVLVVYVVPILYVIHARHAIQAFWIGFLIPLVARHIPGNWPIPHFLLILISTWPTHFSARSRRTDPVQNTIEETIVLLLTLFVCVMCGFISASIYKSVRSSGGKPASV